MTCMIKQTWRNLQNVTSRNWETKSFMLGTVPALDTFITMENLENSQRIRNFLKSLVVGDVIFAQVIIPSPEVLLLKVLSNCSDFPRVVPELRIVALILTTATVPAVDKKGVTRGYMPNDLVCVVVSEVNAEKQRLMAVMNVPAREGQAPHPSMGLIYSDDLPEAYKLQLTPYLDYAAKLLCISEVHFIDVMMKHE